MNTTYDRIEAYYPFDHEVIERAHLVADKQLHYGTDYQAYFNDLGLPEAKLVYGEGTYPFEIMDINPESADPTHARIIDSPMDNPLDPNNIYQAATLFAMDPTVRTIAVGSPSAKGYGNGVLGRAGRREVANGNLRSVVDPVLRYMNKEGVTNTEHIGFSWGAEKAVAAGQFADKYDQQVETIVATEPAAVKRRLLPALAFAFARTDKALPGYVNENSNPAFVAARKDGASKLAMGLGLGRLTNIAIGRAIARGTFETRVNDAFEKQPQMMLNVIWGTESELALDGCMKAIVANLRQLHGDYIRAICIKGQKHNMVNDLALQAAIVAQSLKR